MAAHPAWRNPLPKNERRLGSSDSSLQFPSGYVIAPAIKICETRNPEKRPESGWVRRCLKLRGAVHARRNEQTQPDRIVMKNIASIALLAAVVVLGGLYFRETQKNRESDQKVAVLQKNLDELQARLDQQETRAAS